MECNIIYQDTKLESPVTLSEHGFLKGILALMGDRQAFSSASAMKVSCTEI